MTRPRPIVIVTGRHRPHEQLLLAYSALVGAAYLASGAPDPPSMSALLSTTAIAAWAVGLATSGVVGLVGCWWRGERGLGLEMGGLLINAAALVVYSTAAFTAGGMKALLPGGIVLAWACANVWRAAQAFRDINELRRPR